MPHIVNEMGNNSPWYKGGGLDRGGENINVNQAFFSIFGGGAQHAANNRKKC